MPIHTFGDSHSSSIISGWKDCDNIVSSSYWTGYVLFIWKRKIKNQKYKKNFQFRPRFFLSFFL